MDCYRSRSAPPSKLTRHALPRASRRGSPTSQKVTFEQLRRGAQLPDLAACLQMENRMVGSGGAAGAGCCCGCLGPDWPGLDAWGVRSDASAANRSRPSPRRAAVTTALQVHHCVMDVASDFYTGVTAALITRSGSPAWAPATLKDVSRALLGTCHGHAGWKWGDGPARQQMPVSLVLPLMDPHHTPGHAGAARARGPLLPAPAAGARAAAAGASRGARAAVKRNGVGGARARPVCRRVACLIPSQI